MTRRIPEHLRKGPGGAPRKPDEELSRWTLARIKAHCIVTVRDCWEWRAEPGKAPRSEHAQRYVCVYHAGERMVLRRVAYLLMFGKLPEGKKIVPSKCDNQRCQNPAHCTPMDEGQKSRLAAARGSFATPERARAIAAGRQANAASGMTMEKARRIRAIEGPAESHCHEFGISKSMFNRIRKGAAWKEPVGGA